MHCQETTPQEAKWILNKKACLISTSGTQRLSELVLSGNSGCKHCHSVPSTKGQNRYFGAVMWIHKNSQAHILSWYDKSCSFTSSFPTHTTSWVRAEVFDCLFALSEYISLKGNFYSLAKLRTQKKHCSGHRQYYFSPNASDLELISLTCGCVCV